MCRLFLLSLLLASQVFGAEPSPKRYQISPTEYSTTSSDDVSVSELKRKPRKTIQIIEGPKESRPTYEAFREKIRELKGNTYQFEHFLSALQAPFIPSDKHLLLRAFRDQNFKNLQKFLKESKFLKVDDDVLHAIRSIKDKTLLQVLEEVPELLSHDKTYELIVPELLVEQKPSLRQFLLKNYAQVAAHLPAMKIEFGSFISEYFKFLVFLIEVFEAGEIVNIKALDLIAADFVHLCCADENFNEQINDIDWPSLDDDVIERIFLASIRGGLVTLVDFFMENFTFEADDDFTFGALKGSPLMLVENDTEMLDLLLAYDLSMNSIVKIQSRKGDYERTLLTHLWFHSSEAMKDRLKQEEYKLWTLKRAQREALTYNITDLSEFIMKELKDFDDVLDVFDDFKPETEEPVASNEATSSEDGEPFTSDFDLTKIISQSEELSNSSGFLDDEK